MQKTVWITGANSGIGEALAYAFARKGYNLVLSARRKEVLEEVAQKCDSAAQSIEIVPLDLTNIDSFSGIVADVKSKVSRVDILINNGGISQRSAIIETPLEVDRKIFEVNYFGTIAFTKAVLPWMVETGGGNITAISSISGKFGFHLRASYSATKHALFGFYETLGLEHIKDNIFTTIVCPGRIQTNISKNALDQSGKPTNEMDAGLQSGMPVDECARKIVRGIEKNKRELWVGRKELLLVYIHKYLPRLFWKIAPNIDPK